MNMETLTMTAMQTIENARDNKEDYGVDLMALLAILADMETLTQQTENDFEAFKIRAAINVGMKTIDELYKRGERMRKAGK